MSDLVPAAAPPALLPSGSPLERVRAIAAQPAVRKTLPLFLGLAALGTAVLAYQTLAPAPQRMLYSQLDDAERAQVASSLDKAGIAYSIDSSTGAMTVDEADLYKARMLVASDGGLAVPESASSLDNMPLGASRTLEGERLRGAREQELVLTIQEIEGVEAVRVHLAEAAKSVFVQDDKPASASVMVRMARGRELTQSQVAAIVNLVAGSVQGLSPDAVRVIDQHGRLVSQPESQQSDRFEMQGRLEDKLRGQIDTLLTPMLGVGNFSSEIQVDLDMDEVTSAKESYDKSGVMRSETAQQSQTAGAPGAAGGVPGVLSNTPPPATTLRPGGPAVATAPAPTAQPAPAAAPGGESSATRTYDFGREVSVANAAPGRLKRLSVAVALSREAMKKSKAADVEQIKQLVAAAVGADPARGDQVAVMVRPFQEVTAEAPPFYEQGWFSMVLRYGAGLIAVILVLLLGIRPLIRALKRDPAPAGQDGGNGAGAGVALSATNPVDAALLGRQLGHAQRLVADQRDDAVVALRQMLGQAGAAPR